MQDKLQGIANTPAVTERRGCPRLRVTSLMYIDIGSVNGGIVTSLSENGLALTAGATLGNAEFGDGPLRMQIQFPGTPEALEASGEIVWTGSSGKEARVRFVAIAEKARDQIRRWISDQAYTNGLRPEPPKLPKMRLPNSPPANTHGPRFSFADVASSRVDAESETGLEDSPEIAGEPGELPPLQVGTGTFRDGAEAVASAFENPAFAENGTGKIRSPANEQTAPATSGQDLQRQPTPSIPERRHHARRQILLFTYVVLGEDNGGLVFNLGEGGLALTAAAALREHHFGKMRVRFPDSADWFETSGRLTWKNVSGREAGIEFLNLPEDARARIREWISQGEPTGDLGTKEDEGRTNQIRVQELPGFMEPEESSTESFEVPASFEEQPFENQAFEEHGFEDRTRTPAAASSALFKTGIKGIFERASLRRRVAKIKPPRLPDHSARLRTRFASKALSIAAGVALAVGGWMFLQRTSLNEASGIIAQNVPSAQPSHELTQEPDGPTQTPDGAKPQGGAAEATPDPPVQLRENTNEDAATQTGIAKPSVQQIESGTSTLDSSKTAAGSANSGPERTSKEKPHSGKALAHVPIAGSLPRSLDQAQRPAPSQREQQTKSPQTIASASAHSSENKLLENKLAESKPAESKPVQTAPSFPAQNKDLNATPRALNSNPAQPAAAPPVDMEKEKPSISPKQPEPILARTPVVTISFDPYPSIRMPKTEKLKKSPQGKSLQMGRLLMRVDPVYPDEAKQQGVEGTARVHAIFNRDGSVQSVISVSGPPLLVTAVMSAVRQWRYSQTVLGGQAMETEEDVTVLFRLANPITKN